MTEPDTVHTLKRIADALEALSGTGEAEAPADWDETGTWVWQTRERRLRAVTDGAEALPFALLKGIGPQIDTLHRNTKRFVSGYPANNALLWGARGMGKSSLVKSVHAALREDGYTDFHLIEIHREDLDSLPLLLRLLRREKSRQFLLFCDDLSFDEKDSGYKSLKAVLEGGIEGRPDNVLLYATSNRRHLIPRQMIENERETAIHPGESVEEKVSLSDRFGLWLGFYPCDQDTYLEMIRAYANAYAIELDEKAALEWATTRGHRSGRTAWQFITDKMGTS